MGEEPYDINTSPPDKWEVRPEPVCANCKWYWPNLQNGEPTGDGGCANILTDGLVEYARHDFGCIHFEPK